MVDLLDTVTAPEQVQAVVEPVKQVRRGTRKAIRAKATRTPRAPREASDTEAPAPRAAAKTNDLEVAYWNSVQNSKDPGDLESYLDKFPNGFFADLAERRIRQLLQAEANGGEPEMYTAPVKRKSVQVPTTPIPTFEAGEDPRYLLLADFFAENDTKYDRDSEIVYFGPPNEHMLPRNEAARRAKREQEEYLDACWAVKCKAEGRPVAPRPKEMADQIEAEMGMLRAERGVAIEQQLPPSRPDLTKGERRKNPNADRVGAVSEGGRYADRMPAQAPMLGRQGDAYQREVKPGFGPTSAPLA